MAKESPAGVSTGSFVACCSPTQGRIRLDQVALRGTEVRIKVSPVQPSHSPAGNGSRAQRIWQFTTKVIFVITTLTGGAAATLLLGQHPDRLNVDNTLLLQLTLEEMIQQKRKEAAHIDRGEEGKGGKGRKAGT